jgi:hypothetical protein
MLRNRFIISIIRSFFGKNNPFHAFFSKENASLPKSRFDRLTPKIAEAGPRR